ncbi:hypothetical protein EV702DRAFT_1096756 [Suillus placidus]|uniref:Protein kinase domain-containing protein n=1 Tax=Suillus placidus TaxID=48579 RepID=A0A9P6ZYA1_9AGAM|nr:hypothetical protein EV702DRAFT_1096756 [Suillus placidus]
MHMEHQPVILGRIGKVSKQYTNPLVPRGVDNGPAGTTMGVGSTWNTNFERPKPPPTIGELEDVARQRFASSATDTQDGLRRERQRITAGNFTSEEDAQAARHFNDTRRGGTADADPWYYVPPLPITGRDRDRISASDQQRDRHRSCANIDPPSSIPALPSSAPYNPGYTAPIHGPPVSAVITAMKSVSFDDSGEQSGSSHKGRNGLSRPQVSYTRPGVLPPSIIRPTAAKKSVSLDSGVQPSMSLNDWNGPSDIQDSYARHGHGVPLPSSSRPVVAKKSVSFDSAGFQPSSSRAGPSRLPYEAHYEFSYPLETPKESWQSSNRLPGSSNYPVWPTNTHHGVSEGEYNQTLNQFLNEAQQKELEMRRNKEEETKRKEDEIKWKDGQAQRWEGFTRHAENSTRRFGGEERRPAQDPTFQGEVARATEEVIRRTEEESTRWEGLHSLEDLTNEVRGRSSYPIASGGFGDIWKCVLVKSSEAVQVAVKTIRAFESDNEEVVRKNAKVMFLFCSCQFFR